MSFCSYFLGWKGKHSFLATERPPAAAASAASASAAVARCWRRVHLDIRHETRVPATLVVLVVERALAAEPLAVGMYLRLNATTHVPCNSNSTFCSKLLILLALAPVDALDGGGKS